jgi:hypothetical protein
MSEQIIKRADIKASKVHCDLCSSMGAVEGVKDFSFIYFQGNNSWTLTLCKECSEKIALFLIRSWRN